MKGSEAERIARRILEMQGWTIHQARAQLVRRHGKVFSTTNDLWGCIDLGAIHPYDGVWLIQVTTPDGVTARRRKIEAAARWPLDKLRISIFEARVEKVKGQRRQRRYFRIHDMVPGAWVTKDLLEVPAVIPPAPGGARAVRKKGKGPIPVPPEEKEKAGVV